MPRPLKPLLPKNEKFRAVEPTLTGGAGAALAPRDREHSGAALAIVTALPLAYLTLAARKRAMQRIGQPRSGLVEDALVVAAAATLTQVATRPR